MWDCQCNFQPWADKHEPPGPPSPVRKVGFGESVGLSGDVETSPPPPRGFVYSALSNPRRMRSSDIIFLRSNQERRPGNIASNSPVPSLQNLIYLIPLMTDFKSGGRTRKSREVMQLQWDHRLRPDARNANTKRKVCGSERFSTRTHTERESARSYMLSNFFIYIQTLKDELLWQNNTLSFCFSFFSVCVCARVCVCDHSILKYRWGHCKFSIRPYKFHGKLEHHRPQAWNDLTV